MSKKTVRIEALATVAEAKQIKAAAKSERLSVSAYIVKVVLERLAARPAA